MEAATLERQLESLANAIGANPASYRDSGFWTSVGDNEIDRQLMQLADLFMNATDDERETIRRAVMPQAFWNLNAYVRRSSLLIYATSDSLWLRRALAVAAIEDGRFDFRDLIVSLVIARAAAERVGVDHIPHFNWCIENFELRSRGSFTNARDHEESDVRDILREFGPPELVPNRE